MPKYPDQWAREVLLRVEAGQSKKEIVAAFGKMVPPRDISVDYVKDCRRRARRWGDPRPLMSTGLIKKRCAGAVRRTMQEKEQLDALELLQQRMCRFSKQIQRRLVDDGGRKIPVSSLNDNFRAGSITWKKLTRLNAWRDEQQVRTDDGSSLAMGLTQPFVQVADFVEHLHACNNVQDRICCLDASHVGQNSFEKKYGRSFRGTPAFAWQYASVDGILRSIYALMNKTGHFVHHVYEGAVDDDVVYDFFYNYVAPVLKLRPTVFQ